MGENTHPLNDPKNWTQEKRWIIPVEVCIKVDDATKYDAEMQSTITNVLNELRSICSTLDGGRRMLTVLFRDPIKNADKFNDALEQVTSKEVVSKLNIQELVAQEIAKALKK